MWACDPVPTTNTDPMLESVDSILRSLSSDGGDPEVLVARTSAP